MESSARWRGRGRLLGRLGERLTRDGIINDEQLRLAIETQRKSGGFLGEILVSQGAVSSEEVRPYLEDITGFPFVDIIEQTVDPELSSKLDEALVNSKLALPFREEGGQVHVAMADPLNLKVVDEIRATLGKPIIPHLALTQDLRDAIKRTFDVRQRTRSLLEEMATDAAAVVEDPLEDLLSQAEDAPIVRLVKGILSGAVSAGASD
ncbi:MAG TPA: hypothetical protein VG944_02475, partial [Fimbriimonas sp.]|nr:hypothetical protein [Fimbriimonas sp.]